MSHDDKLRDRPEDQPLPVKNEHPFIDDLIGSWIDVEVTRTTSGGAKRDLIALKALLETRRIIGVKRYGTPLQPFNGRDAMQDLIEELVDSVVYIRQALYEETAKDTGMYVLQLRNMYFELLRMTLNVVRIVEDRKKT